MTFWRKSSSHRPTHTGCWAAYPYQVWSDHTCLPIATLKRHLDTLEQYGLIERVRGRHGGSRVLTFIRPTELALKVSTKKVGKADWLHLLGPQKPEKPKPVKKGQTFTPPFHSIWSKAVAEATESYQVPLTQKKKRQLRSFQKACPKGQAELVALTIIDDWHLFTQIVKTATGQYSLPAKPNIDFALKHVQHAVTFCVSQGNPIGSPAGDELKSIAKPKPEPKPKHVKATPAEMQAILFGEDDD